MQLVFVLLWLLTVGLVNVGGVSLLRQRDGEANDGLAIALTTALVLLITLALGWVLRIAITDFGLLALGTLIGGASVWIGQLAHNRRSSNRLEQGWLLALLLVTGTATGLFVSPTHGLAWLAMGSAGCLPLLAMAQRRNTVDVAVVRQVVETTLWLWAWIGAAVCVTNALAAAPNATAPQFWEQALLGAGLSLGLAPTLSALWPETRQWRALFYSVVGAGLLAGVLGLLVALGVGNRLGQWAGAPLLAGVAVGSAFGTLNQLGFVPPGRAWFGPSLVLLTAMLAAISARLV